MLHRLLIPRELVVGIVQKIIGYSLVCEVISFQNVDLTLFVFYSGRQDLAKWTMTTDVPIIFLSE